MAPMITIRYHQSGKTITLYDYKKHKRFKGVLYINSIVDQSPSQASQTWSGSLETVGHTALDLPLKEISKAFLGLATMILLIALFPIFYAEVSHKLNVMANKPARVNIPSSQEFNLIIPKINLKADVIPNVDFANEDIYLDKLKKGVAHAKGSYFPGQSGPVVLFSHSTDTISHIIQYNAQFYALNDLKKGDSIVINYKGKIYNYEVNEKKIINPDDIDIIKNSHSKLILSTCWPAGTDWQRLVVFSS